MPTLRHGLSKKKGIYYTWKALRARINYQGYHGFRLYGGRGLLFDPTWTSFEAFERDMSDTYYEGARLHRVDSNLGYFKDNCVWVPPGPHAALHNQLRAQRKTHCKRGHALTESNVYRHPSKPNARHCRACNEMAREARKTRGVL